MVIEAMVDMDMVVMVMVLDTMARGRPKLSQAILEDMVDMDGGYGYGLGYYGKREAEAEPG